jgi:hypothetical protein
VPIEVTYRSFSAQIYEALPIRPRKAIPSSLDLLLHDLPAGLGCHGLAVLLEGRDQCGLARPGAS